MDSCSLVYDELCDIPDAACAQGPLGFDPQSLFVDHLGHLVTAAISHCPDQRRDSGPFLQAPIPYTLMSLSFRFASRSCSPFIQ